MLIVVEAVEVDVVVVVVGSEIVVVELDVKSIIVVVVVDLVVVGVGAVDIVVEFDWGNDLVVVIVVVIVVDVVVVVPPAPLHAEISKTKRRLKKQMWYINFEVMTAVDATLNFFLGQALFQVLLLYINTFISHMCFWIEGDFFTDFYHHCITPHSNQYW